MVRLKAALIVGILGWAPLPGVESAVLKTGALNPSQTCGGCHRDIYDMWQRSVHSSAFTDPIFETSYLRALRETGGEARTICIRCHAPGAALISDANGREEALADGIACDFCHSVVSVNLERREGPFQVKLDGIKRGPLGDADSPVHQVARSPLHETSEFCAGCHEYTNGRGINVLSTYTEWRTSPQAAQGKTCLHCHMPQTPGRTVRSGLGKNRQGINLHNISGGHSRDQVKKAATVRILEVRRDDPSTIAVDVEVANVGSGHSIPTGMPTRRLTLEVFIYSGSREVRRFERHYQKRLLDGQGEPIVLDHRTILDSHEVLDDNRLRPGERRVEKFVGNVPRKGDLRAEARLTYVYQPELILRQQMSIVMASDPQSP